MRQDWLMGFFLCVSLTSQRSFVGTAPISEGQYHGTDGEQDKTVQELMNLKNPIVKTNGEPPSKVNQKIETIYKEVMPTTKIDTTDEIPLESIHKTEVNMLPTYESPTKILSRRSQLPPKSLNILFENSSQLDKGEGKSGMKYSAIDVAEYVFWTGDDNGVRSAMEDFLKEGLISKEEAIAFLQEIKHHLENLNRHYTQIGLSALQKPKITQSSPNVNSIENLPYFEKPVLQSNFDIKQLRYEADKRRDVETPDADTALYKIADSDKLSEEYYDELLERLRVADLLYTEYSLEEVVYQLAKVMFTQSFTRGSVEAQQALQKFTDFLEFEAAQGHISRVLEKKVLDILIASISDTLTEHPELLAAARKSVGPDASHADNKSFLKQILDSSLDDDITIQDLLTIKRQNKNNQILKHNKGKIISHVPFSFLNYNST